MKAGLREKRVVKAFHGRKKIGPDHKFKKDFAASLQAQYSPENLLDIYSRFSTGTGGFDSTMRGIILRALVSKMGDGVVIEPAVGFKHPETFEIGKGVYIGSQTFLQGRINGKFVIGHGTWIGPNSYFDARSLVIGKHVGWGPGAKVLGSAHTGIPIDKPIISTSLEILPVRIGDWTDVGMNAVIMPGVTVGKGCIIGAGAVVTKDTKPFSIVTGVPARFARWRDDRKSKAKR